MIIQAKELVDMRKFLTDANNFVPDGHFYLATQVPDNYTRCVISADDWAERHWKAWFFDKMAQGKLFINRNRPWESFVK